MTILLTAVIRAGWQIAEKFSLNWSWKGSVNVKEAMTIEYFRVIRTPRQKQLWEADRSRSSRNRRRTYLNMWEATKKGVDVFFTWGRRGRRNRSKIIRLLALFQCSICYIITCTLLNFQWVRKKLIPLIFHSLPFSLLLSPSFYLLMLDFFLPSYVY